MRLHVCSPRPRLALVATGLVLAALGCSSCGSGGEEAPAAASDDDGGVVVDGAPSLDAGEAPDGDGDARPSIGLGHPFGSHLAAYATGTISPSGGAAALDEATAAFYAKWKGKYLVAGCGVGRYYVDVSADGAGGGGKSAASITVSEAHGYGMLIAVSMAGKDPDARKIFDGLYAYFRDHPSVHDPDLMAWNQVAGCKNDPSGGNDSATDGDLDIAHALLLANAQWGSAGAIDYLTQGKKVIAAIRARELSADTRLLRLGDWADPSSTFYRGTRPSDFIIDHFRAFAEATGDPGWGKVVDAHFALIDTLQSKFAPSTGLLSDFVIDTASAPRPPAGTYLEEATDGAYSYNACRVPWRLGVDYLLSGDPRGLDALTHINAWIRGKTGSNPSQIADGYTLAGNAIHATLDNNLAFIAPFGVAAMAEADNQPWLDALWSTISSRAIADDAYFGNALKMLSMITISGNAFRP